MNDKNNKFFALLTDFGFDFAVASMKGLIFTAFPNSQVIDVDHGISHFSILSGAFIIGKVYKYFPKGTIFVCVVDPGVGSKREPIFLDIGEYKFIGPNNGLFHYLISDKHLKIKSYVIKPDFKPTTVSNTFHGRDLFTPAAIEIAKDNYAIFDSLEKEKLKTLSVLNENKYVILYIDGFGNIKTNIPIDNIFESKSSIQLCVNNVTHSIKVQSTFSDVKQGELFCYRGSNETLEIAANLDSAGEILGAKVEDKIYIGDK